MGSRLNAYSLHVRDNRLNLIGHSTHSSILQHQNHVAIPQSTWTMGNHQGRPAFHQLLNRVEDRGFGMNVQGAGGLVEYEDGRVLEKCTSQGYALSLSTREFHSTLTYQCVVSVR